MSFMNSGNVKCNLCNRKFQYYSFKVNGNKITNIANIVNCSGNMKKHINTVTHSLHFRTQQSLLKSKGGTITTYLRRHTFEDSSIQEVSMELRALVHASLM